MKILKDKKLLDEVFKLYELWIQGLASLPIKFPYGGLWKGEIANTKLRAHVMELIANRKKSEIPTVIDLLMELREESKKEENPNFNFTDFDMAQNLVVFLVAGHETIVSGLLSMIKLLAQNREVFEKVYNEVWTKKQEIDNRETGEGVWTFDDLKGMNLSQAVVKETLRCVPPVAGGMREIKKQVKFGDYTLFPGEAVMIYYSGAHQMAFHQHEKFWPERWITQGNEDSVYAKMDDRKSFCTFAGGDRSCIGMKFALLEMHVFLVNIITKGYWWKLDPVDQNLNTVTDGISKKYVSGVQVRFEKYSNILGLK